MFVPPPRRSRVRELSQRTAGSHSDFLPYFVFSPAPNSPLSRICEESDSKISDQHGMCEKKLRTYPSFRLPSARGTTNEEVTDLM